MVESKGDLMDDRTYKVLLTYSDMLVAGRFQTLEERGVTGADLLNDVIEKRLQKEQIGCSLPADLSYLKRSIKNRAIDLVRELKRERTSSTPEVEDVRYESYLLTSPLGNYDAFNYGKNLAQADGREEHFIQREETVSENQRENALAALKSRLTQTNKKLKECERTLARSARVDRHAVFLFNLRITFAYRVKDLLSEMNEDIAAVVELLLPWDDDQRERVIKEGWPTLQELWVQCRKPLNVPPHRIDAQAIGNILEIITNGAKSFSPDAWYQWVGRAKKDMVNNMGEKEWERLFVPILGPVKKRK